MKKLIYGARPIGQWLALRPSHGGPDVTVLARNESLASLRTHGIEIEEPEEEAA